MKVIKRESTEEERTFFESKQVGYDIINGRKNASDRSQRMTDRVVLERIERGRELRSVS